MSGTPVGGSRGTVVDDRARADAIYTLQEIARIGREILSNERAIQKAKDDKVIAEMEYGLLEEEE